MRILWFVNIPFPAVCENLKINASASGWWMIAAAEDLLRHSEIKLGVAWASPCLSKTVEFEEKGVKYYCFPGTGTIRQEKDKYGSGFLKNTGKYLFKYPDARNELAYCKQLVDRFRPEIVHIHGTENFYGLLTPLITKPVLISLQGILASVYNAYLRSLVYQNSYFSMSHLLKLIELKAYSRRERDIFRVNKYYSGRSTWAHNRQQLFSPHGIFYSDVGCMLRKEFFESRWEIDNISRYSVYTTTTPRPYKGIELLIDAVSDLRIRFPEIKLRICCPLLERGYGGYLRGKVKRRRLENVINFLGYLRADGIGQELMKAHAFVLASFVENSPNSLAEAQLIGTPCVASCVGGVPSMIDDGVTGLLFPRGNKNLLKRCLIKIFTNDKLANNLSRNSRKTVLKRNDPDMITNRLLEIYNRIIGTSRSGNYDNSTIVHLS